MQLLEFSGNGIYCPIGNFYIDPWIKVDCAIITHAHADHARWGNKHYIAHYHSIPVMKYRLGKDISVRGYEYGESFSINGVNISLHPAGHIIGSSQVRLEYKGEVWVVSGDYKLANDHVSTPFEPVKCHHFISESTFGLPIFKWRPQQFIFDDINNWWKRNAANNITSVIGGYSLGKTQRILANIDPSIGPVFTHGAVENILDIYRNTGYKFHNTTVVNPSLPKDIYKKGLIITTPSSLASSWMRKFEPYETAVASGWMTLRGTRRRKNVDQGFALSDHADWDELHTAIKETEAEKVYVTHGYTTAYVAWLREQGWDAYEIKTQFFGESIEEAEETRDVTDATIY